MDIGKPEEIIEVVEPAWPEEMPEREPEEEDEPDLIPS